MRRHSHIVRADEERQGDDAQSEGEGPGPTAPTAAAEPEGDDVQSEGGGPAPAAPAGPQTRMTARSLALGLAHRIVSQPRALPFKGEK